MVEEPHEEEKAIDDCAHLHIIASILFAKFQL